MNNLQDVSVTLNELIKYELSDHPELLRIAKQWSNNDIIKVKLAQAHNDWMQDVWDHNFPRTLKESIIYYLEHNEYLDQLLGINPV